MDMAAIDCCKTRPARAKDAFNKVSKCPLTIFKENNLNRIVKMLEDRKGRIHYSFG